MQNPDYYNYYEGLLKNIPEDQMVDAMRHLCKNDLFFLSEFVLRNKDSEQVALDEDYQGEMSRWLEKKHKRKMLMAPRGHFKSTIANRNYVIQRIINDPNIISISY